MKNFILVLGLSVLLSGNIWGQCTPPAPTGNPGFSPDYNNLPCIEQGNFYSEVFLLENVDTLNFNGGIKFYLDELVLDSITNLPCGLSWIANDGNNTWDTGETGCIRITGTTNDAPGQYKLGIYIHAPVPALGTTLTGELSDIVQQLQGVVGSLGIDYRYYVRVKQPNDPCPAVVTNNTLSDLTASSTCTADPNAFAVSATTPTAYVCLGDSVDLDLQLSNAVNPVISWDNGATLTSTTTASTTAFPSTTTFYTATVTDSNGTGNTMYARFKVVVSSTAPDATFNVNQNGFVAAFNPVYTTGSSYSWDFGDGTTLNTKQPLHTFQENGTYTVSLTVENICGTQTYTEDVVINVVGIEELNDGALGLSIYPNPTSNNFELSIDAELDAVDVLTILDMQGRTVLNLDNINASELTVDVSTMQPGMYFIHLLTVKGNIATQRLLITP